MDKSPELNLNILGKNRLMRGKNKNYSVMVNSISQACRLLGVTHNTIEKLIEDKIITATKVGDNWKFSRMDLVNYLAKKGQINQEKVWTLKGDFATEGIKRMAKRTFQELASNIEELLVNAYDADATLVEVVLDVSKMTLQIIDDGNGMDENSLHSYVVYGQSEKNMAYKSPIFGRSPIGEYGMGGKLAITNLSQKCQIVTRKNGKEHIFTMNKTELDKAKYLSDVKREVITVPCDKELHGTSIFMEDLLYDSIDIGRLVERFSTKMPKSQNFKIRMLVIKNNEEKEIEIKEPVFEFEERFDFSENLPLIGKVNLAIYYTKEPVPATKQGIWTKVNGRIVNEKQEWFGLLNLTSGQRYRWRLYGYGEADGLKDFVTFSKNDFIECTQYREYYDFVHKCLEKVQKNLLKRDEDKKKDQERTMIKEVERTINRVIDRLDKLEQIGMMEKNLGKEHTPDAMQAPLEPISDLPSVETESEQVLEAVKRGKDRRVRRNQSLTESDKMTYSGDNYIINTVDLSERGDLVKFTKDKNLIEINERHPVYSHSSQENHLNFLVRDLAFSQIAVDYSEGNTVVFNRIFNELMKLYTKYDKSVE